MATCFYSQQYLAEVFTAVVYLGYYFKIKKFIIIIALYKDNKADYSFINMVVLRNKYNLVSSST